MEIDDDAPQKNGVWLKWIFSLVQSVFLHCISTSGILHLSVGTPSVCAVPHGGSSMLKRERKDIVRDEGVLKEDETNGMLLRSDVLKHLYCLALRL